ncbi:hypothetical protein A3G55_03520 [Candidatus Giovannonibacteria bacterium RIFCSPLOWO2_12_FULL_44_25]|uniref:UDP-N-acetylglucosamine 1-carboxyvinyltransferase n=2 Tax=Candidatus Giovannoniibacteriota TaxID=1752738 RepID=A0A1F5WBU2_9BACT|nr:MAG: UDP-N-acetylglucosamine 1-carboxyvinyltransferase [Parcubacteria group bacterium GW2011_GWC1_44_10]KKT59735.1 MAG: UDP-N-acetylglucosamine 1-carboxyvinyltransferase [Candidatus Giovannonibacteria bacterium GW2011_GWA1_44_25]KKU29613.1 MAG: UDP-N-acetylglucosamine 1-carboxyvinyltransferase [Candidatus Giovannonibacteria bacterium GW2011_GWB1_46_20]OGF50322.1 MAG: hypothetical protein A2120_01990 [Candidatus Giovannonibacteria bacterium GWA2_45_15]OGF60128.1 MAG: hypothetical protein A2W4
MAKFLVNGGRALEGEISVSGSKNASLPALAASLLFSDAPPLFQNLPEIEDIKRMKELLQSQKDGRFDYEVAKKIRASILAVGPALARFGRSSFPHPGGCVIGARPIDVFFDGWKAMGAIVEKTPPSGKKPGFLAVSKPGFEELGGVHSIPIYEIRAPQGLRGCDFTFRVPSVTGTEGLMMTAVLAQGRTILRNVAEEPEILSLADWLNKNGAKIGGAGTHTITIEGRGGKLLSGQVPFLAPPDRIEAGSLAILGAIAAKKMTIKNFPENELTALLGVLKTARAEFEITHHDHSLFPSITLKRATKLRAVNVQTKEYPGFATDLQAPYTVLATQAEGVSMIHETIFEGRLNYVEDLNKIGARINLCDPHRAIVHGPSNLTGWNLEGPDIRAGLAFLIAALVARGESQIGNIYQIDRGHEKIDARLRALGADIKRMEA